MLAFVLGLVNAIIAIVVGLVYFAFPVIGPIVTAIEVLFGVLLLVGAVLAKGGKRSPAWILLLIGGILTIPIGILGIVAALKARNLPE